MASFRTTLGLRRDGGDVPLHSWKTSGLVKILHRCGAGVGHVSVLIVGSVRRASTAGVIYLFGERPLWQALGHLREEMPDWYAAAALLVWRAR